MCVLLLPLIPIGVIGTKPRGDTREKQFFFHSTESETL